MRFIEELLVGDAADRWHLSVGIQMLEPLVTRLESLMQELIFRVGPSKDPHSAGSAEPGRTKLTLRSVQGPRHSRLDVPHGRAFRPNRRGPPLSAAECRRARITASIRQGLEEDSIMRAPKAWKIQFSSFVDNMVALLAQSQLSGHHIRSDGGKCSGPERS